MPQESVSNGLQETRKSQQHLFEWSIQLGAFREKWEKPMGLHGTNSRTWIRLYSYDGKDYDHIVTRYIDYRTCTKCGIKRTTDDNENHFLMKYVDPAVEPLGGGEPIDDMVKQLEEQQKNL